MYSSTPEEYHPGRIRVIDLFTLIVLLAMVSFSLTVWAVLQFRSWKVGTPVLILSLLISAWVVWEEWSDQQAEMLRSKVNITDLREELNSKDVFYSASSTLTS